MDITAVAAVLLCLLFVLLFLGVWVAAALFVVGFVGLWLNDTGSISNILATTTWGGSASWSLAALPLFIWMGEILFRSRLSHNLFHGLAPWMRRIPGRLLHVNILASSLFAAVSGSSAATTATVGKICLPELQQRRYPTSLILATLAGSGTLGFLIPPSIILIVYGVSAQVSISRLFIAGIVPAVLLILLFMGWTMAWSLFNSSKIPDSDADTAASAAAKWQATRQLLPVLSLILCVLAFIYLGWATAIETAAIGVTAALVLAKCDGSLTRRVFTESLLAAVVTSTMICFIIAGAAFLSLAMGFTGIPKTLAETIVDWNLNVIMLIAVLTLFFILLGFFLDGISIVILTSSVILPMVTASGIDLIWFGVYLVLVVEMSQITPPVGFNLFVLQNLSGENLFRIAWYALPFFLLLLLLIVIITLFPALVTWLPQTAFSR